MKKVIFIFLFFPILTQAQTIWYVSASGNDVNGAGTVASPWRTVSKATSTVPAIEGAVGDIIHIGAGTFYIASNCDLSSVTLEGEGYTTNVIWTLTSDTWGIDVTNSGSTIHIRNIRFNGNNTIGKLGINVYNTNNVWIHDCFFENFLRSACNFEGTTYRTGNRFYNNIVTNCSGGTASGYGDESYAVKIDRQTSFVFDYNICDETIRTIGYSGVAVGGLAGTNTLLFRNNHIYANYHNATYWTFGVEFWYGVNPTMTGNTFVCEIDWGGFGCTGLTFSDNIVGPTSPIGRTAAGLQIEQYCEDIIISRNIFKNLELPIYFCNNWTIDKTDYIDNVEISVNLIYGVTGYSGGRGIFFETGSNDDAYYPPTSISNIKIYNNTIVASTVSIADYGILLPSQARTSNVTNINVRNNIIIGFSSYAIYAYRQDNDYTQAINTLNITYNNYYGNGSNSAAFNGFAPTSYTSTTGIITSNPLFVSTSDFHLQTGSGSIRTGVYIATVITDLSNLDYLNPPSLGSYEYTSESTIPSISTTIVTNILATTATSGGYISSDGGGSITARGVCWSTSINPTIANSHTSDGTGTGTFISSINGLSDGITYYVRAYATNSIGTAYGSNISFTASSTTPDIILLKHTNNQLLILEDGTFLRFQ